MPYDHDEVVKSVIDFYNSLTTKLHFHPSGLKAPPPTAWSQINQPRFAFLGKTNKVLELLQYLPYLPAGPESKYIYDHTVCADYTDDEAVDEHAKYSDRDLFEPVETVGAGDCPWEKFASRHEHLAVLGKPEVVSLHAIKMRIFPQTSRRIPVLMRFAHWGTERQRLLCIPRHIGWRSCRMGYWRHSVFAVRQCERSHYFVEAAVRTPRGLSCAQCREVDTRAEVERHHSIFRLAARGEWGWMEEGRVFRGAGNEVEMEEWRNAQARLREESN